MDWAQLESEYEKWIEVADKDFLRLVYSVCIANRYLDGKPVWLIIIGPSGSGKTEILESLTGAKFVIARDSITAVGLATAAEGAESLLFRLNKRVLVVRDMSSITGLHSEQKLQLFSFLRAAYDGKFVRTTGRKEIDWEGKFGFIGASTDVIEREQSMASQLGERFLYIRPRIADTNILLERVIRNVSNRSRMAAELKKAAAKYWDEFRFTADKKLKVETANELKDSATIIAKCRASVSRDPYTKHVTFPIEDTEVPTRLLQQLILIALGIKATGGDDATICRIVRRITLDCIPYTRLRILKAISEGNNASASMIARYVKVSNPIVIRHLEELEGLGLITRDNDWEIKYNALRRIL